MTEATPYIINFNRISPDDQLIVGGKNVYLGDMIQNLALSGVKVPEGFALTTLAYKLFLEKNNIKDKINKKLTKLDVNDLDLLAKTSREIQQLIMDSNFCDEVAEELKIAFKEIIQTKCQLAVRSSATAEDMPKASFAGQQETILNIKTFDGLIQAIKQVYASLFAERSIAYRVHQNIQHDRALMSVGIQRMIRSDKASSGIMFTLDTESGFDQVILISSTYGIGEIIVQGKVSPDQFYVHKPTVADGFSSIISKSLGAKNHKMIYAEHEGIKTVDVDTFEFERFSITDAEIITLAKYALAIESQYQAPMDIEWAKDGITGELYIVQARPETVKSHEDKNVIKQYHLKDDGKVIVTGNSVGQKISKGIARYLSDPGDKGALQHGEILITESTGPDWEPIMKKAAGIITDHGGRTCHAAIIARELGIPAVVGCHNATKLIKTGDEITLSCAEGETGFVYEGLLNYNVDEVKLDQVPKLPVNISMNISNPFQAFKSQQIPNDGVGLARIEFIIANMIGIHPQAIIDFDQLSEELKLKICEKSRGYLSPRDFYIQKLAEGIGTIAAAFYPKPVIVRLSDFKTNEYVHLLGGELYEKNEENPMLGYRGAFRYTTKEFAECFSLECEAIKQARERFGLSNISIMIPFVRSINEAKAVISSLKLNKVITKKTSPLVYMMCEVPSNVILADTFLNYFDGYSIGSNDLTQLVLGVDRESSQVASAFNERDPAVKKLIQDVIQICRNRNKYIGICGQAPSDYPDFAKWLLDQGVENISLNPDSVLKTILSLSEKS